MPEWVAYPFSRGSSRLRYRTRVSLIAGDSLPAELQGSLEEELQYLPKTVLPLLPSSGSSVPAT